MGIISMMIYGGREGKERKSIIWCGELVPQQDSSAR